MLTVDDLAAIDTALQQSRIVGARCPAHFQPRIDR
ncbi:aldehyde oxidase [Burkholderia cenocepacia]|uniref:Aldehyde oxidase n=1 Tax=Burkholderia cenocepacia TaxID=95486 RepID=A0A6J5JP52_9BURK|nr:aldehyde oxidase [Burkholderia cenocepacia]